MRGPSKIIIPLVLAAVVAAVVLTVRYTTPVPKSDSLTHQPRTISSAELETRVESNCPGYQLYCVREQLKQFTGKYGPTPALVTLTGLVDRRLVVAPDDFHQVAHEIGRETAKEFGSNGKSFLLCPTSYNYGCQHGFFEHVLGRSASAKAAAESICGPFASDPAYSGKFEFYCYHGVGHGVMMAQAYDLKLALGDCDSLSSTTGREGCWQGVFMENVNGGLKGEAREGVFSSADPLAPCDRLVGKYQYQCFINHAGWLMNFFHGQFRPAIQACLKAPGDRASPCLQSLGLMVTNPGWQVSLTKDSGNPESIAWSLCREFPDDHIQDCIFGAVDNIQNFDGLKAERAGRFCGLVDPSRRMLCYERIGVGLRSQATDTKLMTEQCGLLGPPGQTACLSGAGLLKQ